MVVNLPINIEHSVNQLPRNFSESQTIQLQLFWKLSYTKLYLYVTIGLRVVLGATRYISTTELCKQQKLSYQRSGKSFVGLTDTVAFIVNPVKIILSVSFVLTRFLMKEIFLRMKNLLMLHGVIFSRTLMSFSRK